MKIIGAVSLLLLLSSGLKLNAQSFSVSTNLAGYMNLATLNLEASYAVSRHWSLNAGVKYNPFTYRAYDPEKQFQNRQQTYALGMRYWLWHVYSGWWVAGKLQYSEYNAGGIITRKAEEGDAFGLGLSAGYTLMLHPNFNIEFGMGLWTGVRKMNRYSCTVCGITEVHGIRGFVFPNDLIIAVCYVF